MHHIALQRDEIAQLAKVIAHLDAQPPGPQADRREHPRIDFSQPMWLNLPAAPGQPWVHVLSRNLSTSGLAFLTRGLFYNGQHAVISHQLNEPTPVLALCEVCFCRTVALAIHEVGLRFITSAPDPQNTRIIPLPWVRNILQRDFLVRQNPFATPTI